MRRPESRRSCSRFDGAGFTLLEILVSISVIALLMSILLPTLAAARRSSREVQSLANIRQHGMTIASFSRDHGDHYPATEEGKTYQVSAGSWIGVPWWQVTMYWTGVVYDYLPVDQNIGIYQSPGRRLDGLGLFDGYSSYVYSTSCVGQPALWTTSGSAIASMKIAQRTSAVRYPTAKVILWDRDLSYLGRDPPEEPPGDIIVPAPELMADGSASTRPPSNATPAFPNPFLQPVSLLRLHNTPEGVFGRDYAR